MPQEPSKLQSQEELEDNLTYLQSLRANPGFLLVLKSVLGRHSQVHRDLEAQLDSRQLWRAQGKAQAYSEFLRIVDELIDIANRQLKQEGLNGGTNKA